MTKKISTYADLLEEKERLKQLLALQKQQVADNWNGLKEGLQPVSKALGFVGKLTSSDKSNPLLNSGLKLASDLLIKNLVLSKAGWLTKLAVPFVVKNYSSHLLADKGKSIAGRLLNIFSHRKKKAYEQQSEHSGSEQKNSEHGRTAPRGESD